MYTIANIFNWIMAIFLIAAIIVHIVAMTGNMPADVNVQGLGTGTLVATIISLLFVIITIILVRIAKSNGTSKGWDILFIVLGVLDLNPFYILGGIFGVVARRYTNIRQTELGSLHGALFLLSIQEAVLDKT